MKIQSAPPNWHVAVNLPMAVIWMVGIPFAACVLLSIPLWWLVVLAPVWSLLTGRITDRWLPQLTGPVIDRLFFAIGGQRKPQGPLMPESEFSIETTDASVRVMHPDGTIEEVSWDHLTGFDIETNELGPFAPDVFWVIRSPERAIRVPQGATGDDHLLERLQQLPGFDNEAFIAAMASTEEAVFKVWRSNGVQHWPHEVA